MVVSDVQVGEERSVARICEPTAPVGPKIRAVVIVLESIKGWTVRVEITGGWKTTIWRIAGYVQGHTNHYELGRHH